MCEERFSRKHMAKIFNWKIFVSLVGLVSFFSFFYQTLLLLNHSAKHIPISSSLFRNKSLLGKRHDDNNFVACKLPELDPFHPSVIHFTKDFGKLRCNGASYSSFENNVLRVEGTGVVSVQYRTIQRPLGDDFGVVLSDPVRVRNEEKRNQTGECFQKSKFQLLSLIFWFFFFLQRQGGKGNLLRGHHSKFFSEIIIFKLF